MASSTLFTGRGLALGCSLASLVFSGVLHAEPSTAPASIARPAAAAPAPVEARGVRIDSVTVPASVGERTRETLRAAIARTLSDEKLDAPRAEYSVSISLRQLRRYIGPDAQQPELVCILDVALHDARGGLVGSLSGRASGSATARTATEDVLDAAARSTLARLPEALKLADKVQASSSAPKRRLARR